MLAGLFLQMSNLVTVLQLYRNQFYNKVFTFRNICLSEDHELHFFLKLSSPDLKLGRTDETTQDCMVSFKD